MPRHAGGLHMHDAHVRVHKTHAQRETEKVREWEGDAEMDVEGRGRGGEGGGNR
jgi:hypothetical protein